MSAERGSAGAEPVVFDRAAGYYDETRGFPPGAEARVAELFLEAGALGASSRVLEVGIGTGRIALPLAAHVASVAGVDLSAPMLARLASKREDPQTGRGPLGVHPARADAAALPFRGACFDAVIGVHVFHLIPRWRDVMAEVARVLRPGAPLLVGGDDGSGGAAWARWRDRLVEQFGIENPGVARARLEEFPADLGWGRLGEPRRIRFGRRIRPQALLDRMAQRTWSLTWRMSDADLAQAVAVLRDDLLAAFGRLDHEVDVETGFWIHAWLPPSP